ATTKVVVWVVTKLEVVMAPTAVLRQLVPLKLISGYPLTALVTRVGRLVPLSERLSALIATEFAQEFTVDPDTLTPLSARYHIFRLVEPSAEPTPQWPVWASAWGATILLPVINAKRKNRRVLQKIDCIERWIRGIMARQSGFRQPIGGWKVTRAATKK